MKTTSQDKNFQAFVEFYNDRNKRIEQKRKLIELKGGQTEKRKW